MSVSRRSFLVAGTVAGGSLLVGCASSSRQQLRGDPWKLKDGQVALNGWIKLAPDDTVTVVLSKSEMGQGIHTGLMMLVAEELDADWAQLRTEYASVDKLYGNVAAMSEGLPFRPDDQGMLARSLRWVIHHAMRQMGIMMTGGSSSMKDLWLPMREAAVVTRATLVEAAARHWKVSASQVKVSGGQLTGPAGQKMRFGEAVALLGPSPSPARDYQLKSPDQFGLIGKPVPRHDSADKISGKATFGIDVQMPDMLYAAVQMSPVRGGKVKQWNGDAARKKPGVAGVMSFEPLHGGSGGVAVVASRYWQAVQAMKDVVVSFDDGPMAGASSSAMLETLRQSLTEDEGFGYWRQGDAKAVIAGSQRVVRGEYSAPWLSHATMEPMNCTVRFDKDRATVWAPSQVPGLAREAAAKVLGLEPEKVELNLTYLGGGFGRRLEVDFVAQAAAIAREFPGRTVQTLWSREQDLQHDFYRPACVARYEAALDAQGGVQAWHALSAGQAITPAFLGRTVGLPGGGPDKTTAEGAFDTAYEFPAVRVAHVTVDLPVPVGFWRAVGHSHQAFFKESFVDECAHAAGQDPLAYRLALLKQHPRQAAVLQLAAQKAGWGQAPQPAADGAPVARGIALHESFGSIVAQVAEVSVNAQGQIRVHRVVCAIDCGLPVNPNTIAQQVDSSVVYGLSAALAGEVRFEQGRAQANNFHDQPALRLAECPTVETHILPSTMPPEGVGEPALPPIAPAVANALFVLTKQRLRSLPLRLKNG